MRKLFTSIGATIALCLLSTPVSAQEAQGCFMINSQGRFVSLSAMCPLPQPIGTAQQSTLPQTPVPATPPANTAPSEGAISRGGRISSGDGNCTFASDRDSAGRRCGARAASERSGGR